MVQKCILDDPGVSKIGDFLKCTVCQIVREDLKYVFYALKINALWGRYNETLAGHDAKLLFKWYKFG